MYNARELLSEAQRLQTLACDDDRLQSEFPRESRHYESTFRDYEDFFRREWHDSAGRERLLNARYLSLAADLRIATVLLRGCVRYSNRVSITTKRAEIKQCIRQLAELIRNGITDEPDRGNTDAGKALGFG